MPTALKLQLSWLEIWYAVNNRSKNLNAKIHSHAVLVCGPNASKTAYENYIASIRFRINLEVKAGTVINCIHAICKATGAKP